MQFMEKAELNINSLSKKEKEIFTDWYRQRYKSTPTGSYYSTANRGNNWNRSPHSNVGYSCISFNDWLYNYITVEEHEKIIKELYYSPSKLPDKYQVALCNDNDGLPISKAEKDIFINWYNKNYPAKIKGIQTYYIVSYVPYLGVWSSISPLKGLPVVYFKDWYDAIFGSKIDDEIRDITEITTKYNSPITNNTIKQNDKINQGTGIKLQESIATIQPGKGVTGNRVTGRRSKITISLGYLSNQKVYC